MSRIESSRLPIPSAPASDEPATPTLREPQQAATGAEASTLEVFRGGAGRASSPLPVVGPRCGPRAGEGSGFDFAVGGSFPPRPTGNLREQMRQGAFTLAQSEAATASLVMRGGAAVDGYARGHLKMLEPNPPIHGAPTSLTDYTSSMPGVTPEAAFHYFVKNPGPVFASAGIRLKPETATLTDRAKVFLEEKGPPPVWAPVTFRLEPEASTVHITTLDGHPLRGTNRFVFEDDRQGGTRLRQYSAFQGSSPATSVGLKLMDPIERQHDIWRSVHGHLHDTLSER
ncbi:hypothetical protein LZ198_41300 [Myxococcus sp. K15C18031901]|uniref:hypothetical protein n=1 Tax=Myxococcus dinghuensis TaxID=2906761 RepID=UPI0020A7D900|nr:hypothetical protein [Myxococcus dinghuensis]MCP3105322.1 hypothetical protein [Myxococcus dinghuensis]